MTTSPALTLSARMLATASSCDSTHGRAFKHQQAVVHACGLDHAAVDGDVAGQHGQAAFLGESVLVGADAAFGAVFVQAGPAGALAEGHLRGDASGPAM